MSKQSAQIQARDMAVEQLRKCDDISARLGRCGLTMAGDGTVGFRLFGVDAVFNTQDYSMTTADGGKPIRIGDEILMLHYLLCDVGSERSGEFITFRDFVGGQFYWQPFLSRSIKPLVSKIGNDLDLLKKNLAKFDYTEVECGDFAADIHAMGDVYVRLIYRLGDEEFEPRADVLFDSSIKRIFVAEDAAVIAGRICIGLLF